MDYALDPQLPVTEKGNERPHVEVGVGCQTGSLRLNLVVTDPEVVTELSGHSVGVERDRFALAALRVGVLSLRMASGHVDAAEIREAGHRLVSDIRELMTARGTEFLGSIESHLTAYFDPTTGVLPQRIQSLVCKDGELETVLRAHLGSDHSALAQTLAKYVGNSSPIFRMLSPTETEGLLAQLSGTLSVALQEQKKSVLREFSLDNADSALSRLVAEITKKQGQFTGDMGEQMDSLAKEFSLDRSDSALSRLVARIELAQTTIASQFSADNADSALNRLLGLMDSANRQIGQNLTLDNENSALSVLKRELQSSVSDLAKKNADFHADVRETLARLEGRRTEAARSTRHGLAFEGELGTILAMEAQRVGDMWQPVGNKVGAIKNCKSGDFVTTLGPESAAPGALIAWEAKEDRSFDLVRALSEVDEARKNRQAQVGIFVFSKRTAPDGLEPLARYGNDLIVVWDPEDPATDLNIKGAYSVARALSVRLRDDATQTADAVQELELATRAIEKQLQYLDEFRKWGQTIQRNGESIASRAERMKAALEQEVARLDEHVAALKTGTG